MRKVITLIIGIGSLFIAYQLYRACEKSFIVAFICGAVIGIACHILIDYAWNKEREQ